MTHQLAPPAAPHQGTTADLAEHITRGDQSMCTIVPDHPVGIMYDPDEYPAHESARLTLFCYQEMPNHDEAKAEEWEKDVDAYESAIDEDEDAAQMLYEIDTEIGDAISELCDPGWCWFREAGFAGIVEADNPWEILREGESS